MLFSEKQCHVDPLLPVSDCLKVRPLPFFGSHTKKRKGILKVMIIENEYIARSLSPKIPKGAVDQDPESILASYYSEKKNTHLAIYQLVVKGWSYEQNS